MNIDTINKNKIKISLSDEEIDTLFGGYEMIDYDDPHSKAILNMLLGRALPEDMLPLDCKRVIIEVRPKPDGCTIYFTRVYPKSTAKSAEYVFIFSKSDDMLSGITELQRLYGENIDKSCLYTYCEKYFCIALLRGEPGKQIMHLKEYCSDISRETTVAAMVREYGQMICAENAVKRISAAFSDGKRTARKKRI